MKSFFVRSLAVIGFLTLLVAFAGAILGWRMLSHGTTPSVPDQMILTLDLSKPVVEGAETSPISLALSMEEEALPLHDIIRALNRAKDDPRVKAVVARFGSTPIALVHAQELRESIRGFAALKPTYAFGTSFGEFGHGNKIYYLASAFKEVWLQPTGTVGLTNLGIEAPFGKSALDHYGVTSDFIQREEYKSAMEEFTRDSFSVPAKANLEQLISNLELQMAQGIAENRGWDSDKVLLLMQRGPYTATEALQRQLVTRLGYEDEIFDAAKKEAGEKAKEVDLLSYLDATETQHTPKAKVALIAAEGIIVDQQGSGHSLAGDRLIDTDTIVEAFRQASEDKDIKAVVFRINSPGGSPVASESIRHAIDRTKTAGKPVFVSMGEVAASGGYWIAMNADKIIAEPATLTGSIGVVAGKFVVGALSQNLGVKWDRLETGENAHLSSPLEPYSQAGKERMNALVDETYQAFISYVSAARRIPLDQMPNVAKGRVFTGEQAQKLGLVDALGGLQTTILAVKEQLKIEPSDPIALVDFPPQPSLTEVALKFLRTYGVQGVVLNGMVRQWLGPLAKFAPLVEALTDTSPVSAKMATGFSGLTR